MIRQELKSRTVYGVALISASMLLLAYQVKIPFEIDLGQSRHAAQLRNFYDVESTDGVAYRWSSPSSSILFPGIGG